MPAVIAPAPNNPPVKNPVVISTTGALTLGALTTTSSRLGAARNPSDTPKSLPNREIISSMKLTSPPPMLRKLPTLPVTVTVCKVSGKNHL